MTQPPAGEPTRLPDIDVRFSLQPVPGGGALIRCTIAVASVAFTLLVAPDQADQLAPLFSEGFTEGAAAARRAGLGLVLPRDPGIVVPTNGHNGARPA